MAKNIIGIGSLLIVAVAGVVVFLDSGKENAAQSSNVVESNVKKTKKVEEKYPEGKLSDWNLVLVNYQNKIKDENPPLEDLGNGYSVDKRIVKPYEELANAAEKAGFPLQMVSGFRSISEQEGLINENIAQNEAQGMTYEEAKEATMKLMTPPGYGEHNTGLAVDVVGSDYYNEQIDDLLNEVYANDPSAKWLAENAPKYGFILRYPKGKEKITNIDFEPWHFRYVGVATAEYITQYQLTLEEYTKLLEKAGR
ncbi:MAG: M15 family metallopeptidase [Lactobacillales bacterium]|jgi:D-alanyl-D-alanine carboxypeptidase|nr:M15 family metallopeptidase [Lactobacillales bacterium]